MQRIALVAFVLSIAIPAVAGGKQIIRKQRPVQNSYIVLLKDDYKGNCKGVAHQLARRHAGMVLDTWEHALLGFAVAVDEAGAQAIAEDPRVLSVQEDAYAEPAQFCIAACAPYTQTISRCNDARVPWQLDRIDQPDLPLNGYYENTSRNARNVDIYIIDSGVSPHSEFEDDNGNSRLKAGYSFWGGPTTDADGHGTRVAGMAAGKTSGVAKGADIIPVRVGNATTYPTETSTIAGINWIIQNHDSSPAVANISLIFGGSSSLDSAANNLVADGVIVVAAAGNANSDSCRYSPGRAASVITVGATTKTDAKASYSNHGSCIALYAPGEGVGGAIHDQYQWLNCSPGWGGTSMASPLVAGVAALAYGVYYNNGYTPTMIRNVLTNHAVRKVTGVPSGTTRLLQSSVTDWESAMCALPCTDPRCIGRSPCPSPDR
ncbi:MAG TPA: S8 family serine peptidase [Thermoanaerobaculia bacterium]|nr:S8 family serine peptidase [Thermoanaerobaculia bacterium]